jgi:hypothetical protein
MTDREEVEVDRRYWETYRNDVDASVRHAQSVAGYLRQAAAWVAALVVIGAVGAVAAIWTDDSTAGLQALGGAAIALPALLLIPLCAWALSSLVEIQAWNLDLALLDADLEEAVGESETRLQDLPRRSLHHPEKQPHARGPRVHRAWRKCVGPGALPGFQDSTGTARCHRARESMPE